MMLANMDIEVVVSRANLGTVGAVILCNMLQVFSLHVILEGGEAAEVLPEAAHLALVFPASKLDDLGPN